VNQLNSALKQELQRLIGDKTSTVLDLGDRRVLITTIDTQRVYELDDDLNDPFIAEIVARGYEEYQTGQLIDHQEVIQQMKKNDAGD